MSEQIGDVVVFVDGNGVRHNALVIYVFQTTLNIAYVGSGETDSYGNLLIKKTSVPFKEDGMSGFYID